MSYYSDANRNSYIHVVAKLELEVVKVKEEIVKKIEKRYRDREEFLFSVCYDVEQIVGEKIEGHSEMEWSREERGYHFCNFYTKHHTIQVWCFPPPGTWTWTIYYLVYPR